MSAERRTPHGPRREEERSAHPGRRATDSVRGLVPSAYAKGVADANQHLSGLGPALSQVQGRVGGGGVVETDANTFFAGVTVGMVLALLGLVALGWRL